MRGAFLPYGGLWTPKTTTFLGLLLLGTPHFGLGWEESLDMFGKVVENLKSLKLRAQPWIYILGNISPPPRIGKTWIDYQPNPKNHDFWFKS